MSNKVHSHIFLLLKNIDHNNRVLEVLNNIYLKKKFSQGILAVRLILKERKIGKLHEASVQRSCQGSLQSTYTLFGKF